MAITHFEILTLFLKLPSESPWIYSIKIGGVGMRRPTSQAAHKVSISRFVVPSRNAVHALALNAMGL